jgi:hypothetical protein
MAYSPADLQTYEKDGVTAFFSDAYPTYIRGHAKEEKRLITTTYLPIPILM